MKIIYPFLILIVSACTPRYSNVEIQCSFPKLSISNFKIIRYKNLDQTIVAETKLDSSGFGTVNFNLTEPSFMYFEAGDTRGEMYLTPGDKIKITWVSPNLFAYQGKGADVNNYIDRVFNLCEAIKMIDGEYIGNLDLPEFKKRLIYLESELKKFHDHFMDSIRFNDGLIKLLNIKNRTRLQSIIQEYAFILNNEIKHNIRPSKNKREYLMEMTEKLPINMALIKLGLYDYYYLLQMYVWCKIEIGDYKGDAFKSHQAFNNEEYPLKIREFLQAISLEYFLESYGIKPSIDSTFVDFKNNYGNSPFLQKLNKSYSEWTILAKGKPAPNILGTTINDVTFSLNDLKGKIIYIDAWATWCGPCIREIPYVIELQKEFSKESRIEFLNISIDSNTSAWKNMVNSKKDWKGLHINLQGKNIDDFWIHYKIRGVPSYILIDQNGNIVSIRAPKPSDEKIQKQISELLNKPG